MEGLGSFLLLAAFFYIMMRYGCGAHILHGRHERTNTPAEDEKQIDPVCGMVVDTNSGYGKMHEAQLYRFCSKKCLNQFDADPDLYRWQFKGGDFHDKGPGLPRGI